MKEYQVLDIINKYEDEKLRKIMKEDKKLTLQSKFSIENKITLSGRIYPTKVLEEAWEKIKKEMYSDNGTTFIDYPTIIMDTDKVFVDENILEKLKAWIDKCKK